MEPNNTDELAKSVNTILDDTNFSNKLTNQAHDFVIKNMTWDTVLPSYVQFYEKLVSN